MFRGRKRKEMAYRQMMAGAMSKIRWVGCMKMRTYRFGQAMLTAVQNRPKKIAVPRAKHRVSKIRSPFPAPKLVEMMGCAACPTL